MVPNSAPKLDGIAALIAAAGASLALVALAACGSSPRTIDTPALLVVLKHAGFRRLALFSNDAATRAVARKLNYRAFNVNLGADVIYAPGRNIIELSLSATRLASVQAAKQRYTNDQPLLSGRLSNLERSGIPKDFDPHRVREARVCNVVLTSYNGTGNGRGLARRFARAVSLLRRRC